MQPLEQRTSKVSLTYSLSPLLHRQLRTICCRLQSRRMFAIAPKQASEPTVQRSHLADTRAVCSQSLGLLVRSLPSQSLGRKPTQRIHTHEERVFQVCDACQRVASEVGIVSERQFLRITVATAWRYASDQNFETADSTQRSLCGCSRRTGSAVRPNLELRVRGSNRVAQDLAPLLWRKCSIRPDRYSSTSRSRRSCSAHIALVGKDVPVGRIGRRALIRCECNDCEIAGTAERYPVTNSIGLRQQVRPFPDDAGCTSGSDCTSGSGDASRSGSAGGSRIASGSGYAGRSGSASSTG